MSAPRNAPAREPVAIVGMACLFPMAPDLETFWENLLGKVDAVGDPPASRDMAAFIEARERTGLYCVRGGYLGETARFHPAEFGVMPSAVDGAEPDQFLALELARQTLLDAGVPELPLVRERTEVILGRGTFVNRGTLTQFQHNVAVDQFLALLRELHPEHDEATIEAIRARLIEGLPPITPETAGGMAPSLVSGRIANRFDLKGMNCTIDAACASSLIAVEHATNDLREGRCDAALVGGVQVSTPAPIHNMFANMGALSRRQTLRPFDEDADGTMLGEGAGMVLLKRLSDAERDGNRIYALILSVGTSSDGRAKAVLTPRVEGEELALRRAYEDAGISPSSVGLIEAHGTAMPVGDETEIAALRRVFGDRAGSPVCALGSVKSMISHLLPAAGIAGLIKAALALYHRTLPPTLCDRPNPKLEIEKTPFYLNTQTRPWIHGGPEPRRAGVNAFGFGGINAHAILEEYGNADESSTPSLARRFETELVILQGASREDLASRGGALARTLERRPGVPLRDVAYTLSDDLDDESARLAIVASDTGDLARKLAHALERLDDPACERIRDRSGIYYFEKPLYREGELAFLFPGEGSQYPNMLGDLCLHFPVVRSRFDLMERAFLGHPRGYTPGQFVFPPPALGSGVAPEEQERRLFQMDGAVESVFVASQALHALLGDLGIRPDAVAGHSAGEYSALIAAGATRVDDDEALVRMIQRVNGVYQRFAQTKGLPRVSLIAVGGADPARVEALVRDSGGAIHLAVDNCRYQVVLCGEPQAIEEASRALRAEGAITNALPFDRPYHTPLFEPAYALLRESFAGIDPPRPGITLWSCATAQPYPEDLEEARRVALEQWIRPVRFRETVEALYAAGVRIFVEVGPRGNLTSFVNEILGRRPFAALASNIPSRSGVTQLHHLLGQLAAHGVPLTLEALYRRRATERLDFSRETQPARRDGAIPISLALPRLSLGDPSTLPLSRGSQTPPPRTRDTASQLAGPSFPVPPQAEEEPAPEFQSYFNTMERFLAIQDEVMQAFLGAGAAPVTEGDEEPAGTAIGDLAAGMPLIGEIVSIVPGQALRARRRIDPEEDLFLRDHALGGEVSTTDPSLLPLPLMPFTMTMEMAAQAAAILAPGETVIALRDVRAHRWIPLDGGPVSLEIAAAREGERCVRVEVREEEAQRPASPILEARVILAGAFPPAPPTEEAPLRAPRASRWTAEAVYGEGMFHGPRFQGVEAVETWSEDGVTAVLRALPAESLFRGNAGPRLLIDPILLDAAGQLIGFWHAEPDVRGFNVFPFRLDALEIFGAPLQAPARARAWARLARPAGDHLRSDIDVAGPDGRVHLRVTGWEDRAFDLPEPLCRLSCRSRGLTLSEPWLPPISQLPAVEGLACRIVRDWIDGPPLQWQIAAQLLLGRAERERFGMLRRPERSRNEWLLGRAAAKDAVCALLRERHGIDVLPADVEIDADPLGRPVARGAWMARLPSPPAVAIAHTRGLAAALAADGPLELDVGIDIERIRPLREGFDEVAFTPEEMGLLAALPETARAEWRLRLWCAKEAAGKALGTGLQGRPRDLVARKIDEPAGAIAIEVGGAPARKKPARAGEWLTVRTWREGDLIGAVIACTRRDL